MKYNWPKGGCRAAKERLRRAFVSPAMRDEPMLTNDWAYRPKGGRARRAKCALCRLLFPDERGRRHIYAHFKAVEKELNAVESMVAMGASPYDACRAIMGWELMTSTATVFWRETLHWTKEIT